MTGWVKDSPLGLETNWLNETYAVLQVQQKFHVSSVTEVVKEQNFIYAYKLPLK
jgi:hypothetical protein